MPGIVIDFHAVDRLVERPPAAIAQQPGAQCILRRFLQLRIERGAHPQPASINAVRPGLGIFAVLANQQPAHFLDEIAVGRIPVVTAPPDDAEWLGLGRFGLGDSRLAVFDHLVEHPVTPLDCFSSTVRAPVDLRPAWQGGEERVLRQRQLVNVLAEIGLRRSLNPERLAAERNLVEVELENLRLRQHAFDPPCDDHFLELAGDRIFVADQDVLGDLLGYGRAALGTLARAELGCIVHDRPGKACVIDPAMRPERLVFGREVGVDQLYREVDIAQLDPPFARITIDDLAAIAAHHGRQRWLVSQQRFGRRQVAGDREVNHQVGGKEGGQQVVGHAKAFAARPMLGIPVAQPGVVPPFPRCAGPAPQARPDPARFAPDAQLYGFGVFVVGVSHGDAALAWCGAALPAGSCTSSRNHLRPTEARAK